MHKSSSHAQNYQCVIVAPHRDLQPNQDAQQDEEDEEEKAARIKVEQESRYTMPCHQRQCSDVLDICLSGAA